MTVLDSLREATVQGSVAIGLAFAVCRLLPSLSPTARVWIWRIAFLKLVLAALPIPAITLPLLPPKPEAAGAFVAARVMTAAGPQDSSPSVWIALWVIGTLALVVRLGLCVGQVRALLRGARRLADPRTLAVYADATASLPVRRVPMLLEHHAAHGPMLAAGVRSAIVVPPRFVETAGESEARMALVHELSHHKSLDLWWSGFYLVVQSVFFFNPLVWLGVREALRQQEMRADAMVLAATNEDPGAYAQMLLALARPQRMAQLNPSAALGLSANAANLRDRLHSLYRVRDSRFARIAAIVVCALAVTAATPWTLAHRAANRPMAVSPTRRISFEEQLGMSIDQRMAAQQIIYRQNQDLQKISADDIRGRQTIIWRTNVDLRNLLDPEQQRKFDALIGNPDRLKPQ